MIRAVQAISSAGITWSSWSLARDVISKVLAERRLVSLARISPVVRAHDDAVALPGAGRRRDDEDIAIAIERGQGIARDLESENLLLPEIGKLDLVPVGTSAWQAFLSLKILPAAASSMPIRGIMERSVRSREARRGEEILHGRAGGFQRFSRWIPWKANAPVPRSCTRSTCLGAGRVETGLAAADGPMAGQAVT